MRPVSLTVEGFSAYRSRQTLALDGVELFALGGPTGAGKSSLIDAMMFALYGKVPRLPGRSVAPVISVGMGTAKVALEFDLGDARYTAVRVAERTKSGASVKEARLESDGTPIADGPDDVTEAVTELLRLGFEDFTRTVVLPQGEFSRFLTSTPAERQGLLRKLLGLEIYSQMRTIATTRAAVANERREAAAAAMDRLAVATDDEMKVAKARLDRLVQTEQEFGDKEAQLAKLNEVSTASEAAVTAIEDSVERLGNLKAPDNLETLDEMERVARDELEALEEPVQSSRASLESLREQGSGLPSIERLERVMKAYQQIESIDVRLVELALDAARDSAVAAKTAEDEARTATDAAREALASLSVTHAAHALIATLEVGEPCPVCQVEVVEVPVGMVSPELDDASAAVTAAEGELEKARSNASAAATDLAAGEATATQLEQQRTELASGLVDAPSPEEVVAMRDQHKELLAKIEDERSRLEGLEGLHVKAQRRLEDAVEAVRSLGNDLTAAQLSVAALDPPISTSDDLIVKWKEFLSWRDAAAGRLDEELAVATKERAEAIDATTRFESALHRELTDLDVPTTSPLRVGLTTELDKARRLVADYEKAEEEAQNLAEVISTSTREAELAKTLAKHLQANGFEQWLTAGALDDLVDGSNTLLDRLSSGAHSLQADEGGGFIIVDHRNADEVRSVATLSGGETFLVSLALALSLAETLAAAGGASLETIILDEGFGTLDDESLEIVGGVLEELAGSGLMVGVITHVKDLAARAPTRFEVRKLPGGSVVEEVAV